MAKHIWEKIVEMAACAPSTHNTQAWRISANLEDPTDLEARLFYDNERLLPAEDIHGDFNIINMGIFTKTLEIAAAYHDYKLRYQFALQETTEPACRYTHVANLTLEPRDENEEERILEANDQGLTEAFPDTWLAPLLERRRTSRFPYDGREIDGYELLTLAKLTQERGHQFGWTQHPEEVKWYMELNADTIVKDLRVPEIRKELHKWMRFSEKEAREKGDGLWAKCMNQNALEMWLVTKHDPCFFSIGRVERMLRKWYLETQAGTPAIGWISGSIRTREEEFQAGRFLLEFWLRMTAFELWMLPYGSLYTNEASNRKVGERTGAPTFWLIFRMGYGQTPPKSFRLPAHELFI